MRRVFLIIIVALIIFASLFLFFRGNEDSWIKDERGVYIKHGNPSSVPDYVEEQTDAISCAFDLYDGVENNGIVFDSQCIGVCEGYAVDIVHVPRTEQDNLVENQCSDFREGNIKHFIELDKDGNIIRIF